MRKGYTLLGQMCQYGNDESIDLVERVCKAVPEHITAKTRFGETHLHSWSSKCRAISIGRCLLIHGANVNAKNSDGVTPIMRCAKVAKNEKAIELLLNHNAETHHKDKNGKHLLDYCKENGLKNIEALLLAKK